jgi:LmbE family N-acetylglucosaminyl deacetylase
MMSRVAGHSVAFGRPVNPSNSKNMTRPTAIAIGAHPDDVEFHMAGALILLKRAGYETHYFCLASGNCGTVEYSAAKIRAVRAAEAREGARILGATFHPCITDDLEIVYSVELLRKVAAVIRQVRPTVVLTHSPQDYMEDHMATSRLAVTAAFARGAPNFQTIPRTKAGNHDVTVYHTMPHGLCDQLGQPVVPGVFVNTTEVQAIKRQALAAHKSQQNWLDLSQKFNSFLQTMEDASLALGKMSKKFKYAEGWRRHLHLGFCGPQTDPLRDALGKDCLLNARYKRNMVRMTPVQY